MKIFRNRTVIGVLCILLALIICFGVTPLFSRSASEKTEIVRVTKDIKEGDEITAEMVQTVEVGAYNLPQNLMTDKKEVVGKYATADLAAGDYILSSKLSAVPAAENAYGMTPSGNYIRFVPESFQQIAPIEMYRAKEKLLYRFISEVPVFTYDDQQTLSLNSCNIVIPEIDGIEMKYVLAILNSSVASYFVTKKFNSIKLLRSHIEQIPIPIVSKDIQVAIVKKVDRIMNSSENISGLYEELDGDIMALYGLNANQIETIQTALSRKNLFLKES